MNTCAKFTRVLNPKKEDLIHVVSRVLSFSRPHKLCEGHSNTM